MVAKAIKPDCGLSSHVATLGLAFSKGETISPQFADGVFVGEHGSWDRDHLNSYQVIFVPFENGMPKGNPVQVVTDYSPPIITRFAGGRLVWRLTVLER